MPSGTRFQNWLTPFVYLSSNWISRIGVVLVTTGGVSWLFVLPSSLRGAAVHPYIGILEYALLPGIFFLGLALIPVGIWRRARSERRRGVFPAEFAPIALFSPEVRRLCLFVGLATLVNIIIGSQLTYSAVNYLDSVAFCGQTCHTVMEPEYTGHQNSPHARVECVACHIGPGASWFVQSKLSGLWQVVAVTFNLYPRPIPTPVRNLRPARETCEACHWPQKFGEDRLRVINKYADDEANTLTRTVLLLRIGGGHGSPGIHGAHLGPGVSIRYYPSEESRQTIPRVEYENSVTARKAAYTAAGVKPEALANLAPRRMDCMDCHNRPTHIYQTPERALDDAMASGTISPALPFVKKQGLELLKRNYPSREQAGAAIAAGLEGYYKQAYPAVYGSRQADIARAGQALTGIYLRNIFPAMRVTWGTYPNNIGHTDFPGCFRCHDDAHSGAGDKKITQDCNTCHQLLAMDEASPKILSDLGLEAAAAAAPAK
jgi:hypothetical protein